MRSVLACVVAIFFDYLSGTFWYPAIVSCLWDYIGVRSRIDTVGHGDGAVTGEDIPLPSPA